MFDQFKERLHHVQQDLSTSLKTLSTKAKEVNRSRRDELATVKKDTPQSVPKVCNQEAGAELLDRFQQMWSELHKEIEASAEKAMSADTHVQEVFLNYERRAEPLLQFQKQLQDLPRFVENIQHLTAAIGKLEAEFEEVESMLLGFEDMIGHCELLRNKHTQTAELNRYTQQKLKEEALMRVRLQEEYAQIVRLKEESQRANKIERQKAFQDVFAADMQHYKTYGEMQRVVSSETHQAHTDISSIENFEISVNEQEQEALNDFLGSPTSELDTRKQVDEDNDDEDEEDEEEAQMLEVIEEESEREDKTSEEKRKDDLSGTNRIVSEEEIQERVQHQGPKDAGENKGDGEAGQNGEDEEIRNLTEERTGELGNEEEESKTRNEPQDEEDDDEFDTPEEGSENEK